MQAFQVMAIVIGLANTLLLAVLVWNLHKLQSSLPRAIGRRVARSLRQLNMAEWGFESPAPHDPHGEIGWPTRHDPHTAAGWRTRAVEYFVFWQWKNNAWKHRPETLPRGAQPGPAPVHAGAFDGQVMKTWVGRKR